MVGVPQRCVVISLGRCRTSLLLVLVWILNLRFFQSWDWDQKLPWHVVDQYPPCWSACLHTSAILCQLWDQCPYTILHTTYIGQLLDGICIASRGLIFGLCEGGHVHYIASNKIPVYNLTMQLCQVWPTMLAFLGQSFGFFPNFENHGGIAGKQSDRDLDKGFTNQRSWIAGGWHLAFRMQQVRHISARWAGNGFASAWVAKE